MDNEYSVLENFFHEIAALSTNLSKLSDKMIIAIKDDNVIKDKSGLNNIYKNAYTINQLSEIINLHLTIVNIELNPEFYNFQKNQRINIHGSFYRMYRILKPSAKSKSINLKIDGEKIPHIDSLPIVKVLPFIILDNATKYSPSHQDIDIYYHQSEKHVEVSVSSMGPFVEKENINKLTGKGYRGVTAKELNPNGNGIGLYYFKRICEICDVSYDISSDKSSFSFNGTQFSVFKVVLRIPIERMPNKGYDVHAS